VKNIFDRPKEALTWQKLGQIRSGETVAVGGRVLRGAVTFLIGIFPQ